MRLHSPWLEETITTWPPELAISSYCFESIVLLQKTIAKKYSDTFVQKNSMHM